MIKKVFLVSLISLNGFSEQVEQRFKVQNNTNHTFSEIYVFGNKIDSLAPGASSEWKIFRYNPLTDDSMIYCILGNTRYACYLNIPEKETSGFTYSIRAIQNDILFVDFIEKKD